MIPVEPQAEPDDFDQRVRQKGLRHLQSKGLVLTNPLPAKTPIEPYWRHCLPQMHALYSGVCACLAVYFERITGAGSVDHFIAKSALAGQAYEWSNYRLACSTMNSRKRDFSDVLDPFEVEAGWFRIELVSGRIYANPALGSGTKQQVEQTIKRLGLDDPVCREMRARHFGEYSQGEYTTAFLRKRSPFVWFEAQRQGLL